MRTEPEIGKECVILRRNSFKSFGWTVSRISKSNFWVKHKDGAERCFRLADHRERTGSDTFARSYISFDVAEQREQAREAELRNKIDFIFGQVGLRGIHGQGKQELRNRLADQMVKLHDAYVAIEALSN